MRKMFAGLSMALAVLVAHAMLAPPPSGVAISKTQGSIALIIDNAVLAGRPGGAVLTDISYSDQLGTIVLMTNDGIVPMGGFALSSQTLGVATTNPYDWLGEQQGSVRAIFGSSTRFTDSTTAALCAANPAVTFGGQQESAGIRKLTPVSMASFGGSGSGGRGHATAQQASACMAAVATSTFPQYTAQSSA